MKPSIVINSIIAVTGAFALSVVTRIIQPSERVNALWFVVAAACFFVISYRLYGSFITAKVLALDDRRITPSNRMADGRDYHPTHKWVLFGHHFAAIAGAGPLIGPVLAAQFGYLPGFLWILIGAALGGAVHDTVILAASVRRNGRSLAQIAKDEVGPVAGLTAALAILFIIIVALAGLGFPVSQIHELSRTVGTHVAGRPGGAVSLAVGMASIFSSLPGMKGLMPYWYNFALMFEALFILTTVDTGTRVARFIVQELGGYFYKPLSQTNWMPGTVVTSFLVVGAWAFLIYSGSISTIWPMFGVANQLLAALAFCVGTTVIIKMGKLKYAWVTFLPMLFMFIMTMTASYQLLFLFLGKAGKAVNSGEAFAFKLDAVLVAAMAILAIVVVLDSIFKWYGYIAGKREVITSEVVEWATDMEVR